MYNSGFLPVHHPAAVNVYGLAGDVAGMFGGQEDDGRSYLFLGNKAAEYGQPADFLSTPFFVSGSFVFG
jgi:hypothetical protein